MYANVTLAFKRCCVTKMRFTRACKGTLRVCFKCLKLNVLWIKLTYLLFCRILCCFTVFEAVLKRFQRVFSVFSELALMLVSHSWWDTASGANSLKTLQNGLKHRETTKNTTEKQGKSVLFTEHSILGIDRSLNKRRMSPAQTITTEWTAEKYLDKRVQSKQTPKHKLGNRTNRRSKVQADARCPSSKSSFSSNLSGSLETSVTLCSRQQLQSKQYISP